MTGRDSRWAWYWHRLRAMSAREMLGHARKKFRQRADAAGGPAHADLDFESATPFPPMPAAAAAPEDLRAALRRDAQEILAGHWKAFGQLDLVVDDPPRWHKDHLAGVDVSSAASAFRLNHRALPAGADVKLVWELSRWYALARLAMAARVNGDFVAARKCVGWLADWVEHNPPYRGWNWTSALEVGVRLVQFAWIDRLLGAACDEGASIPASAAAERDAEARAFVRRHLPELRRAILPAHVHYAWRHRSFGSSANNHLLGELAGVIVAQARWPQLARVGASMSVLQPAWEREVLAQFAADGGNREQALNYQLFSWELCWQARAAFAAAGVRIAPEVDARLARAAEFLVHVQTDDDPWDYGDSDGAYVTPVFSREALVVQEWRRWFSDRAQSPAVDYWWGATRESLPSAFPAAAAGGARVLNLRGARWLHFPETGMLTCRDDRWSLRWDASPLGYLATAAHGHLDALHLSLWYQHVAFLIDPGTGAYYGDKPLRAWLASRSAHNGPCPLGPEWPRRLGPFLWATAHAPPRVESSSEALTATLELPGRRARRTLTCVSDGKAWLVQDSVHAASGRSAPFRVRWQLAPGTRVEIVGSRSYRLRRGGVAMRLEIGDAWTKAKLVEASDRADADAPLAGIVSRGFRQTERAPYLLLEADGSWAADTVGETRFCGGEAAS